MLYNTVHITNEALIPHCVMDFICGSSLAVSRDAEQGIAGPGWAKSGLDRLRSIQRDFIRNGWKLHQFFGVCELLVALNFFVNTEPISVWQHIYHNLHKEKINLLTKFYIEGLSILLQFDMSNNLTYC